MIYMSDYSVISHLFAWVFSTSLQSPGHLNENEQDGVRERGGGRRETERQTKFKLKFKVIYLHGRLSHASLKGL